MIVFHMFNTTEGICYTSYTEGYEHIFGIDEGRGWHVEDFHNLAKHLAKKAGLGDKVASSASLGEEDDVWVITVKEVSE